MLFKKKEINDHRRPRLKKAFFLHRKALRDFVMRFAEGVEKEAWILDFGCGAKPYAPYFKSRRYIGVDGHAGSAADVLSGERIPFRDGVFDCVLSFQVLEHVPDPKTLLDECRRVLKPDGTLLISVPFVYEYHACPTDYWRFTHEGLSKLLEEFSDIHITNDTSTGQTLISMICSWTWHFTERHKIKWLGNVLISLFNLVGLCCDRQSLTLKTGYLTSNFIVTAKK